MTVAFDGLPTQFRILHLEGTPTTDHDLGSSLTEAGLEPTVARVDRSTAILEAIDTHDPDLLVIDLPLADGFDPLLIDRVSGLHPEVALVFRWPEDRSERAQYAFASAVRAALEQNPDRGRDPREHSELLAQMVRQQEVILELSKIDPWEFRETVEHVSEALAKVLDVEQVTIWELAEDAKTLLCLDLHRSKSGEHGSTADLAVGPRYLTSLRQSLTISAADAQNDPRTSEYLDDYLRPAGIRSLLDAPIRRAGEVVGVICHEHVGEELRWWSVFDRCVASYAAAVLARAFEVRDRRVVHERMNQLDRMRAIGELAGGIAHDLNNQLGIVLGNLEVATRGIPEAPTDRAEIAILRAQDGAQQVVALIEDLLDIGRGGALEPETIDACSWLSRFEVSARAILHERIRLEIQPLPAPLLVRLDRHVGRRILLNLVKNAGEAIGASGAVEIGLRRQRNATRSGELEPGDYAVIHVRDDGCGMDPETQERVFEPFYTTKPERGGTGLGLATSFGLATQLGGTIRCESTSGRGSTFEWWIATAPEIR